MKIEVLCLGLVLMFFSSCKKENPEFIFHDSNVFVGNYEKIYGKWEYLYSIHGSFGGSHTQKDSNHTSLKITPFDYYEKFIGDSVYSSGKIDTIRTNTDNIAVSFYPDGVKDPRIMIWTSYISLLPSDILRISNGFADGSLDEFYKKISK